MSSKNHDHVDLVTLEEVHRLLNDTEFASADDLQGAGSLSALAGALDAARPSNSPAPIDSSGTPLPKRR